MDLDHRIIESIRKRLRMRKVLAVFCVGIVVFGFASFLFYGFETNNEAIKFIAKKEQIEKVEKVMINPKIKFEHEDNQFFDITAKKAVHKNRNDTELFDVKASGSKGSIEAGNLLITNNGNNLHFSDKPVLIIKEIKK